MAMSFRSSRKGLSTFSHLCSYSISYVAMSVIIASVMFTLKDLFGNPLQSIMYQLKDMQTGCDMWLDRKAQNDERFGGFGKKYGEFRAPENLCGYSDQEVDQMLTLPHNCSRRGNRVWMQGGWFTGREMRLALREPGGKDDPVECLVFCVDNQGPCHHHKCLIPIHLRRNSSDPMVAIQLLEHGEYDIVTPDMNMKTVLDAGANCGIATVIFATMFPSATIVSVEPSSQNFAMLQRNTKHLQNVIPVHAGLWPRVATLALSEGVRTPWAIEWGFMVQEVDKLAGDTEVIDTLEGVSVDFLMEVFSVDGFDLLKIDIEGSEKEVMGRDRGRQLKWLDTARMAMFEVHDDMRPGSHDAVANAFKERTDWEWATRFGEYHIYKKRTWEWL